MAARSKLYLLSAFIFASGMSGCDSLLSPEPQTRIYLSQASAAGARLSISPSGIDASGSSKGGAVLALVDSLNVTITAVQAMPARYLDSHESEQSWETLTLSEPATVDLLGLPSDDQGLEVLSGDLAPGAYVRLRLLISEAELTLRAPLTLGRATFEAGEPIEVIIPDAWVRVPGAFFTVTEGEGAAVTIEFDPSVSLGQLTVNDGRLRLTPVMRGRG